MTHVDRYRCEEALRRLDDYLDGKLAAEERTLVREHLETYAVCASELRSRRST
jgi:anti-sigma factor RsiW